MNAYCINEIPADALSTLTVLNASGATVLSVQPYKNDLGMSAMAYGEKAAEDNEGITNAGATTFAGQEAFAFTTAGDFYEPGGARGITEDGHISLLYDADATEIPFVEVNGSSRVIYTDYNGYFYRITYREIGEEIEAMVQSFKFLGGGLLACELCARTVFTVRPGGLLASIFGLNKAFVFGKVLATERWMNGVPDEGNAKNMRGWIAELGYSPGEYRMGIAEGHLTTPPSASVTCLGWWKIS
ncbi:MAG: hypothetical protein WC777_00475 [Candidatus Gracilibacteria bacterium]